jgi:hypothetical protein
MRQNSLGIRVWEGGICVKEGGRANRAHLIAVKAGVVEEDPGSVVQNEDATASWISALWRVNSVFLNGDQTSNQ